MTHARKRLQRGVSLIEAMVAFAIMGFGMLGVLGMQTSLRASGDLSRQRAEAVRIAQDYIEEWRGFSTLTTTTDRSAYADIATAANITLTGTNASFTVRRTVPPVVAVANTVTPEVKTLVVEVEWTDRQGQVQSLRLSSNAAGVEPAFVASVVMSANADPLVAPFGRFRGIPTGAVPLSAGKSGFVPPGQSGSGDRTAWVFNNTSGEITRCTTTGTTSADLQLSAYAPQCSTEKALLFSGLVRFATSSGAPSSSSVVNPSGPNFPSFGLGIVQSSPSVQTVNCYQEPLAGTQVTFYCAVPITGTTPNWSGRAEFTSPLPIAASIAGYSSAEYKVCRYVAAASYTAVSTPLLSQNFVFIKAGDDSASYQCPTGGSPAIWVHQPTT